MPLSEWQVQPQNSPDGVGLRDVWHAAPVGLAVVDEGRVLAWNPECRRLLGLVVGGTPVAWERWLGAATRRLTAAGDQRMTLNGRVSNAPGLELAASSLPTDGGRNVYSLRQVTGGDHPESLTSGLAATVSTLSHELRTPLTSMKSSLALVLNGDAGSLNEDQVRFLGMTLRNVSRLDRLVGDLLDVARDDVGRLRADCRPTDLGPLLREALTMFEAGTGSTGPQVDATGVPESFQAWVDADKIVQIVANLVGNAVKYVPSSGLVRVSLDPHPAAIDPLDAYLARLCGVALQSFALVVEDNGPGIDPDIIDRVFEPFERGRLEVIGRVGGAGLGLHIVRQLAASHGGRVGLASSPGAGTSVWVRLPLDPVSARLLRAAAQLTAALDARRSDGQTACRLAVFDARSPAGVKQEVLVAGRAFLDDALLVATGRPVEPVPGMLAAIVEDPACRDLRGPSFEEGSRAFAESGWILLPLPVEVADGVAAAPVKQR